MRTLRRRRESLRDIGWFKFVIPGSYGVHDLIGPRDVSLADELLVSGDANLRSAEHV
jgi:hypothetical protein